MFLGDRSTNDGHRIDGIPLLFLLRQFVKLVGLCMMCGCINRMDVWDPWVSERQGALVTVRCRGSRTGEGHIHSLVTGRDLQTTPSSVTRGAL